jgi:hypothetical protein
MGTPAWAAYAISCGEKWKNPDRIKMTANRIRPASVTREFTDACSLEYGIFNALAAVECCDEVEIELLAITKPS